MNSRCYFILIGFVLLSGCSLFHKDQPAPTPGTTTATAKKSSLWPFGKHGPQDATPYLEYQRTRTETDKDTYSLLVRNTHQTKSIEGDIRTTIETAANETKVDTEHFTLGPNETKKLLVYPDKYHLTYEVTAFFKE